ncbi:YHYH protein [Albirhodobacter sp. R86504]|uniref:YHYH protein n=1 Tax=Albirhodobacter sp. R86504 TaxID=3093848 RepID=UPI0036722A72
MALIRHTRTRNTLRLRTIAPLLAALAAPHAALANADLEAFSETAFTSAPQIVDCTLENGDEAKCYEFIAGYQPEGLEIGPFCPSTLDETGGLWDWDGEKAGLYRLDRTFFEMLADQGYTFYDAAGNIAISDPNSGEAPSADHACLMASPDQDVVITMRIPVDPVMADTPTDLGTVAKVGVALDGVPIFADAPSVLQTGHLPALDTCGGHIDPGGWYHWHATSTDIDTLLANEGVSADCGLAQDASAPFGYAFDGFAMVGSLEHDGSKPEDLDQCGGHIGVTATGETSYHYHASDSFPNLPACLVGVSAQDNFATTAAGGIGAAGGPDGGGHGTPPGFDTAAEDLGVSVDDLMQALGGPGQEPDLAKAAAELGVSEDALRAAMPQRP